VLGHCDPIVTKVDLAKVTQHTTVSPNKRKELSRFAGVGVYGHEVA
jgi:hypothetical protein